MSILSMFKSNARKIEDQQKLISQLESEKADLEETQRKLKLDVDWKEGKINDLNKQIDRIESKKKIQIDEMKADRKMHDENLQHLVKIKMEQLETEHARKLVDMEKEKNDALNQAAEDYRKKSEDQLEKRNGELKEMYSEVLERLPNLNASMHIGGPKTAKTRS